MKLITEFFKRLWQEPKKRAVLITALSAFVLILLLILALLFIPGEEGSVPVHAPGEEDPIQGVTNTSENVSSVETGDMPVSAETMPPATEDIPATESPAGYDPQVLAEGIDVSKWQGSIDWRAVKEAGVDFAMIRLGYRNGDSMELDEYAVYNLQQAEKQGVLCGVYFFSGADTPQEAREEAAWVLSQIAGFAISYPVVLDYEMSGVESAVSAAVRTDTALSFLLEIERAGYQAMLYAPMAEFEDSTRWESARLLAQFPVWVARYADVGYPAVTYPETELRYAMWQYTDQGSIPGIDGNVDRNVSYLALEYTPPKDPSQRPAEVILPEEFENQTFATLSERLTAKEVVNLRKKPSIEGEIVGELKNGEWLLCTGKSNLGWARLEYNGQNVYAIYSYLTADTP